MLTSIRTLLRTLTLPNNATGNQAAIVLGPDLPPCMQGTYSAAIFFRPAGSQTGINDNDAPIYFIALQPGFGPPFPATEIDEGWLINDPVSGHCSLLLTHSHIGQNAGGGGLGMTFGERFGTITDLGTGAFQVGPYVIRFVGDTIVLYDNTVDLQYDSFSMGRGPRVYTPGGAVGPSGVGIEIQWIVSNAFDRVQGRAYRFRCYGWVTHSVVGAFDVNIRDTNLIGGAILKGFRVPNPAAGFAQPFYFETVLQRTGVTVPASQVNMTIVSVSGGTVTGGNAATRVSYLEIEDAGDTTLYTNAETC